MSSLLRLEHQRKRFLSLLFKTQTMNTFIHYRRFLETRTRFQSRPFGTAHHSKWLIYGCTPPPPREFQKSVTATFSHDPLRFQNFVFTSLQTYNYPKGIQWENCFCKSCVFGGKDKEKCIMGNVEVGGGGGGGGMDLQRVNGYIDCLSYGFKTSKTQTAHLLSISGVNFILFA